MIDCSSMTCCRLYLPRLSLHVIITKSVRRSERDKLKNEQTYFHSVFTIGRSDHEEGLDIYLVKGVLGHISDNLHKM